MKQKSYAAAGLALFLAIAAYWYWSPYLAVRALQTAAQEGDAEAFNDHVDYPKLRDSLKGQFSALIAEKMGTPKDNSNPFAALGNLIGLGLVNQMVDVVVRPAFVMAAMRNGQLARPALAATPAVPAPAAAGASTPTANAPASDKTPRWIIDRNGVNKMTAYVSDSARPDQPMSERLGLVFERSGFVDWKLTEFRMPAGALNK